MVVALPAGGLTYPWIEPSSVKKDGKYRVTETGKVRVQFTIDRRERELLTTDAHPELVDLVRGVKRAHGEPGSGVFYINEWRHVLVKAGGGTWYAGTYEPELVFDLDGERVSGRAGPALEAGQPWPGVRVGIKYKLNAAGDDIFCTRRLSPTRSKDEYLSDYLPSAGEFVRSWSRHKPGGGGVYINESRELFGPVDPDATQWVYFAYAGLDKWFPTPPVP